MEANKYKGYDLFSDVDNNMVRAFNRLNTIVTINEDISETIAAKYLDQLSDNCKKEVAVMAQWIKREGREAVIKKVLGYVGSEGGQSLEASKF